MSAIVRSQGVLIRAVAALGVACVLTACGGGSDGGTEPQTDPITSLEVSRQDVILAVGGHVQLSTTAKTAFGKVVPNATITWTSDAAAATVSSSGVITGVSAGKAEVTGRSGSGFAKVQVTVMNGTPGAFLVRPSGPTLALGQEVLAQAIAFDADGVGTAPASLTWASSNETVATVDAFGKIVTRASGSATITASASGRTATVPVNVVAFTAITPIGSVGSSTASSNMQAVCAIAVSGSLYCAGSVYGAFAAPVAADKRFRRIEGSVDGVCAVTTDGEPYCWGLSNNAPVKVPTNERFVSISLWSQGGARCGLTAAGKAFCWGSARGGQEGNGLFAPSPAPQAVATSELFEEIAALQMATCARTAAGKVFCWGGQNWSPPGQGGVSNYGVLGIGNEKDSTARPLAVASSVAFTALARAGRATMCATGEDTKTYCWGFADPAEAYAKVSGCWVGTGVTHACNLVPTPLQTALRFTSLANVAGGSCAVTDDAKVACWLANSFDAFGIPTEQAPLIPLCGNCLVRPTVTIADKPFATLTGGPDNACGIDTAGRAYCWGSNEAGQLTSSDVRGSTPKPTLFAFDPSR